MASPWERAKARATYKELKESMPKGQPGGIASIPSSSKKDAFVELQKQKFFGDRDVPEERVLRRTRQEGALNQFKQNLINQGRVLKDSKGNPVINSNTGQPVFLSETPGGRTVSDYAQSLANRFGPTPSEIAGDISYGLGNLFSNITDAAMQGKLGFTGAVKGAWDKLRGFFGGETQQAMPQGIETKYPQVSPEAKGYFGGYNQGIQTQMPVAEDRGMNIPTSIYTEPSYVPTTPNREGFVPQGYSGIGSESPDYYDPNNVLGNIFLNSQGYNVPVSNDLRAELSPEDQQKMINQYMFEKMIREEIDRNKQRKIYDDMQMFQPKENPVYADASQSDIDRINKMRQLKSMDPQSIYDMKDVFQLSPELTLPEIEKIKEGTLTEPTGMYAENIMPTSVMDLYNFARNPQLTTDYGNLRLDNVLSGNPQLNYGNTVMINGVPVDLSASLGQSGLSGGLSVTFNKGGSVDKYNGLGYMLK